MTVRLQACLNGARCPVDVPILPVTPSQLARAAVDAVTAGAQGLHVHPKTADGADTLDPPAVEAVVAALRAAVPGIEIGVTTGIWAAPRGARWREQAVRAWGALAARPDAASVNWHEEGAVELAGILLDAGIGVEAGIWTVDAARSFLAWPRRRDVTRVLVELPESRPEAAVEQAQALTAMLEDRPALLVHGEDGSAWAVLRWAAERGHAVRIGLEDSLLLPDGRPADGNGSLVAAAAAVLP